MIKMNDLKNLVFILGILVTLVLPSATFGAGAVTIESFFVNEDLSAPEAADIDVVAYVEGDEVNVLSKANGKITVVKPGAFTYLVFSDGNFPAIPDVGTNIIVSITNNQNNQLKMITHTKTSAGTQRLLGSSDAAPFQLEMPLLQSIVIEPVDPGVTVPDTQQFKAMGTFEGVANPVDITNTVTWNSSDTEKGTIPAGLFTSNHVGTTDITATQSSVTSNTSTVTVLVGPADTIAYVSGDAQTKTVGTALDNPFVVKVTDAKGNPVSATAVTFAVTAGGGTLSVENATTGTDGTASSTLTLGITTGANTVTATSGGLTGSPVTFNATGTAGAVSAGQSTVGATTPVVADGSATSTITVTAKDQYGNAIQGKAVTVSSTGSNNTLSDPADTDASGETTATLASTKAEPKTVSATIDGVAITDTAEVVFNAGPAAKMTLDASKTTIASDTKGSATLTATILDQNGNVVTTDNTTVVTFTLTAGTYLSLSSPTATAASGVAEVTVTSKAGTLADPPATDGVNITSSPALTPPTVDPDVTLTIVNFSINVDAPAAPFYDAATGVHLVTSGSTPSTAKFSGVGSATGNYRWALSSVGTIDSTTADTINYTAPATITGDTQKDTLTLTSAAAGEETLEDTIDINIYNPMAITWPASAAGIAIGDNAQIVTATDGTGTYKFQSSAAGVAAVNADTGAITPVAAGTLTVQARDNTFGVFDTANGFLATTPQIEIVNAIVIGGKPANNAMESGAEKTFTATGGKTDGEVNWEASAGAITAGGVFTAPTVTEGTLDVTITAYDKTYNKNHYTPVMTTYTVTVFGEISITSAPSNYDANDPQTYPMVAGIGTTYNATAAGGPPGEDFTWSVKDAAGNVIIGPTVDDGTFEVDANTLFASGAGVYTVIAAKSTGTPAEIKIRIPMRFVATKFEAADKKDSGNYKDTQVTDTYTITGGPAAVNVYNYSALDLKGVEVTEENCGTFDPSPTDADNVFNFTAGIPELISFRVKVTLDSTSDDADVVRLRDAGLDTLWSGIFNVTPVVAYTGTVVDADGNGIGGVKITATHAPATIKIEGGTDNAADETNNDGSFTLTAIDDTGATYKFLVSKAGYIDKIVTGDDIEAGPIVLEELAAGSGTIAGTITLAGGGPQTEISIKVKADGAYIKDGAGNDITVFTDAVANDGTYSFPVPVDNVAAASYTVEARKSGFIFDDAAGLGVLTFNEPLAGDPPAAAGKDIELKPVTKISVTGTAVDSDADATFDQVLVKITAEAGTPPYKFDGTTTEIAVEGPDGLAIALDVFASEGANTWSFIHNAYENFTITVYADVGEDRDVDSNYKATLVWNYVKSATTPDTTPGVDPISGTLTPAESGSRNTSVNLPPGGLTGDLLASVSIVIVEADASDAGATVITGSEIVDVKMIDDATGEEVSNFDLQRIEITMKFDPTVVTEGTLGSTYMILQANTLEDLVAGNVTEVPASQIIQPVDYVNGYVTFWVDHLSAFGIGGSRGAGGVDDSRCFIATAAYGSPLESHVKILRDFRDVYLMPTRLGHAFVDAYYRYSPEAAAFIADHESLRAVTRVALLPVVGMSYLMLSLGTLWSLTAFAGLAMLLTLAIVRIRRGPRHSCW